MTAKPFAISEEQFQNQIIELAHLFGWHVAHFRPALTKRGWRTPVSADGKGFMDLVLMRERIIYIECKRETGKLTDEQKAWRQWTLDAGGEYYLLKPHDFDHAAAVLKTKGENDEGS